MSSLIEQLPQISRQCNRILIFNDPPLIHGRSDRVERPIDFCNDALADAPIVIFFGPKSSSLNRALCRYFQPIDIQFKSFSTERQLKRWLQKNRAAKVVSLVIDIQTNIHSIIMEADSCSSIHSILIRCQPCDKDHLQYLTRACFNVNGIFSDDIRLLIKLGFDLSFYSEEMGDYFKEDKHDLIQARRHYDRALSLCDFLEEIEHIDDTKLRQLSTVN